MLKLDPNETCVVTLTAYENEPEATRPAFVMAFPTARKLREAERYWAAGRDAAEKNDTDGWHASMAAALRVGLRDWRNIFTEEAAADGTKTTKLLPFDATLIDDLLAETEMRDLYVRWQVATRLTESEKGGLRPHCGGGLSSANGAAGASASTSQPSPNPSNSASSAEPVAAI